MVEPSSHRPAEEIAPPASPPRRRWLRTTSITLLRLLLLVVGVGGGWLLGLLGADFLAGPRVTPPLQEQVQRRSSRTLAKLRQLPSWWRGNPQPVALLPSPPPERLVLEDSRRQLVEGELSAMAAELEALNRRIGDLERQLGQNPSTAPAAARLRRLSTLLEPAAAAPAAPAAAPPPVAPPPALVQDRITLPSLLLFEAETTDLTLNGQQLLETILPELARYPGATVLILSRGTADSQAAFTRAQAVRGYLAGRLGETYRWVAAGAPQADSPRIEISIVPAQ